MNILITGINGFVGKYVIDELKLSHPTATIFGIGRQANGILDTNYFVVDLNERTKVLEVLKQIEPALIIHLASESSVRDSWSNPVDSYNNNVNIFLNIIESVRLLDLKPRILSVGSSEEYGIVAKVNIPISETCPLNPISPYAVARVSQEMLSKVYVNAFGMDIVLTRSFNHFGPGQKPNFVIASFAKQIAEIKKGLKPNEMMTGDLSIIRDFVDVRDVVKAYILLVEKGVKGEVYNICSGVGNSLKDVISKFEYIADIKLNVGRDPKLIRPSDNPIIIGENSKIVDSCGWKPTFTIDESLKEVYDFWFENLINP